MKHSKNLSASELTAAAPSSVSPFVHKISALPLPKNRCQVAAYCRVSTLSESQTDSLVSQRLYYERIIADHPEWTSAGIYLESGVSGTRAENRLELQRLLSDCHTGKIDLILTKSISRFARNTFDCLNIVRSLVASGINIWFEKENIHTDTMGSEFLLSILSSLAQDESRSLSANIKWGIHARFRSGTYLPSVIPYGYRKLNHTLVINPQEADTVRFIFHSVLSGQGVSSIARQLNMEGISSPSGGKWGSTSLLNIIRNPVYAGDMVYQKTYVDENYRQHRNHGQYLQIVFPSHHEAIVSREMFTLAAKNIRQRGKEYGVYSAVENPENARRRMHRSPLTGKIYCAACGSPMRRSSFGRYPVYSCSGRSSVNSCSAHSEMEITIKNAFLTCLNKLAWSQHQSPSSRIIDVFIRSLCSSTQIGHDHRLEALDLKLIKLRKLQSSLLAAASSGSFSERSAEITFLEQEVDALTKEKTLLEKPSDRQLLAEALRVFISDWQITADTDAFPADFFRNAVTC